MPAVTNPVAAALAMRCDAWHLRLDKMSFEQDGEAEAKTNSLRAVRKCYRKVAPVFLKSAADRNLAWLDRLQRQHGERFGVLELVAESRLLIHLGRANVLENVGLYAERTTGLPIIPGTALKGVVSTWACWAAHFNPVDGSFAEFTKNSTQRRNFTAPEAESARRILGDDNASGSEHAGEVIFLGGFPNIFLGGFPNSPPELGLDIVNPHFDEEVDRRTGEPGVRDKTRLTPNAFLCVEPGTRWRFAFFVRPGVADASALLAHTRKWIEEALTQTGIGAKTAAGYGRFRTLPAGDVAAQQQREAQAATPTAAATKQAEADAAKAKQHAAAQAAMKLDYSNDASFKNRVLDKLNPGQLEQLRGEIPLLRKPENEPRREQFIKLLATRDYKDIRKRLRDKEWFPKDWLPAQ
jgi:CRISPR-associated protein Cmr6